MNPAYEKYIASVPWNRKREDKLQEAGYRCETCGNTIRDCVLQVHHLTYVRFGRELLSDLQVACIDCHPTEDQRRRIAKENREFEERFESAPHKGIVLAAAERWEARLPELDPRCARQILAEVGIKV